MTSIDEQNEICKKIDLSKINTLQTFGFLVVIAERTKKIVGLSENISSLIKQEPKNIIGGGISSILDPSAVKIIASLEKDKKKIEIFEAAIIVSDKKDLPVIVTGFLEGKHIFLEIEPVSNKLLNYNIFDVRRYVNELISIGDNEVLLKRFTSIAYKLSDFDSVMIYQYLPDGSGEVVAQKRKSFMPNFMHHCFPSMDTPPAVKKAFLLRPIRYIPDAKYTPIKLIFGAKPPKLNLIRCLLRGVSPVHVEFLNNMGSGAVVSIPIIVNDEIWGIVAFHNKKARSISKTGRVLVMLLVEYFSKKYIENQQLVLSAKRNEVMKSMLKASASISASKQTDASINKWLKKITSYVNCSGLIYCFGDTCYQKGKPFGRELAFSILRHCQKYQDDDFVQLDQDQLKKIKGYSDKCIYKSIFYISLSRSNGVFILLGRESVVSKKKWAGNPSKHLTVDKKNPQKYSPRKSFKSWVQEEKNQVEPWSELDVMILKQLHFIFSQKLLNNYLSKYAFHDSLTGLHNRHYLDTVLDQVLNTLIRRKQPLSIILLDIDFFKKINDKYGHTSGDKVLKKLAEIIKSSVREADVLCRYGGEEILLLLQDCHKKHAIELAEKLRKKVSKTKFSVKKGEDAKVTISAGVAEKVKLTEEFDFKKLVKRADKRLYQAKKLGRNRVVSSS